MFPVYIKKPKTRKPKGDVYYVVAKNGVFLRKKNAWVDACVPVKQIAVLETQVTEATLLLPPVSNIVMAKAIAFFHAVYKRQYTEAAVLLHYSHEHGWDITVPAQKATSAHVDYKMDERIEGYLCAGTMHSHGYMSAFHSGTDQHDEAEWDGIHITIGNLNKYPLFSMEAEMVVNGCRFILGTEHLEGISVAEKETVKYPIIAGVTSFYKPRPSKPDYGINETALDGWTVPEEWLAKVETISYARYIPPGVQVFKEHVSVVDRTLENTLSEQENSILGDWNTTKERY